MMRTIVTYVPGKYKWYMIMIRANRFDHAVTGNVIIHMNHAVKPVLNNSLVHVAPAI